MGNSKKYLYARLFASRFSGQINDSHIDNDKHVLNTRLTLLCNYCLANSPCALNVVIQYTHR